MKTTMILVATLGLCTLGAKAQQAQPVIQTTFPEMDQRRQAAKTAFEQDLMLSNPGVILSQDQLEEWHREALETAYRPSHEVVTFFRAKDGSIQRWESNPVAAPAANRQQ
jgi:hypothetical protein